jgi:hypothetical protein
MQEPAAIAIAVAATSQAGPPRVSVRTALESCCTLDGFRPLRWRQSSRTYLTPPERPAAT